MNPDDLERRIFELLDGQADAAGRALLLQEIQTNPAAREIYQRCCQLDSALHRVVLGRGALGRGLDEFSIPLDQPRRRHLWTSLATAAALIAIMGSLLHFVIMPMTLPPVAITCEPNSLLTISNPADAEAAAPDGHLHRGSVLRLDQGTVELAFRSQVRAVVRAPAHLVLDSPDQVTLHAGHAWFQVPAGAHGFRVITRDLEVTDLGTEFGVLAEPGRSDEVHVFAGRVLVRHRQDGDKAGVELTQNEALLANPRRTLDPVPVDAAAFTTRLQMHSKNLRWTFDDGNAQRFEVTGSHPALADATATSGVAITSIPGPAGQGLGFHPGQHLATRWQGILGSLPRTVTAWIRVPADLTDEALPSNIASWGQERNDLAMSKWRVGLNPERLGEGGVKGALRTEFGLGWVIGSTDLRDGRWHHIASVYQGGNGRDNTTRILLYVDGVLETQSAGQHQLINTQSGAPLNLAGKGGRIDLDDVQVFESALDASTIADLWRAHAAGGK